MTGDVSSSCPSGEQAVGWVLRALEPDEESAFRAHLAQCDSCREVARETEQVTGLLAASPEQVEPPPRLRDAILTGAARTPQVHRPEKEADEPEPAGPVAAPSPRAGATGPEPARLRPRRWARLLVAAAAAFLMALTGLTVYTVHLYQQWNTEVTQVQRLAEVIVRSKQPGSVNVTLTTDGRPVAAVMVVDGQLTLLSSELAPNDRATTTYVLWGLGDADAAPLPIAAFDVVGSDAAPRWSGAAPGAFSGYAASLEPGRTMPATPTSIVAAGQAG
ncbi:anti-sigma factor [Pseudonocardia charpentierae]|uniref:Regulator of SigK n=1 Tax=Pseudonocardia charpentierae TaxID=3075545 RepID=A0ABU2NCB4_9PSEU|nr:anti-sigma factor [Pseudonocardia sp. DSM 45834]MDT0351237.1 anti-sigma factor [Pseudonocardia sp. DSM 45834]